MAAWCHNGRAPLSTMTTTPKRPPAAHRCGEDLTRNWQAGSLAGWQTERQRQHDSAETGKERKRVHTTKRKNASNAATLMSCKTRVFIMLLKGSQCAVCRGGTGALNGHLTCQKTLLSQQQQQQQLECIPRWWPRSPIRSCPRLCFGCLLWLLRMRRRSRKLQHRMCIGNYLGLINLIPTLYL